MKVILLLLLFPFHSSVFAQKVSQVLVQHELVEVDTLVLSGLIFGKKIENHEALKQKLDQMVSSGKAQRVLSIGSLVAVGKANQSLRNLTVTTVPTEFNPPEVAAEVAFKDGQIAQPENRHPAVPTELARVEWGERLTVIAENADIFDTSYQLKLSLHQVQKRELDKERTKGILFPEYADLQLKHAVMVVPNATKLVSIMPSKDKQGNNRSDKQLCYFIKLIEIQSKP